MLTSVCMQDGEMGVQFRDVSSTLFRRHHQVEIAKLLIFSHLLADYHPPACPRTDPITFESNVEQCRVYILFIYLN